MHILYDSKKLIYKDPFGTLTPNETCTLNMHVPASVGALRVVCILRMDGTDREQTVTMLPTETKGA